MGHFAETFAYIGFNEPAGYEGFDMPDGNEEFTRSFHPCTARGLTYPRRMYAHHDLLAGRRSTNDLGREWPTRTLANDNHVHWEFLCLLREMPELTSLDRELLQRHLLSCMDDMRGFVQMPDDERQTFWRVLLRDISR
ncbi:retrotransposon protein [Cucumis melo var. makuwa]|uniref:Retrotransposon protein n=1 Tax=Cucumis melo var. makuwa TaxID=1194695 RepID=A0A5A7VLR2_CUCMM|nr:retrotransposon protein [Cucumis melo var. makuwa]